jgi:DNA-binding transcriptional LysR family regulator
MNINLLKTFLEVARVRHFGKAAEKVCLTQSAVSARIKLVEDELGVKLFTRTRNDIQLTREGRRLARTAENIVKQWEQTKNELSLTRDEGQQLIRMGIVHDIWSILPTDWLSDQRRKNPNLLFQVQAFSAPLLTERLLADEVDFAIMFDPPHQPGLDIIEIGNIRLHLISDRKLTISGVSGQEYIYVDWGESFSGQHQQQLGDLLLPSMSIMGVWPISRSSRSRSRSIREFSMKLSQPPYSSVPSILSIEKTTCLLRRSPVFAHL